MVHTRPVPRFRITVVLAGKTATGIQVPADVVADLGRGKRPPVRVSIRDHTYRSTVAAYGAEFWLPVSEENRRAAGVTAGDDVEVDVELDTDPREVVVPADFAAALDTDPEARRFFDGLSYSKQRRYVLSIEDAKAPETRQRRIAKAVSALRAGQA